MVVKNVVDLRSSLEGILKGIWLAGFFAAKAWPFMRVVVAFALIESLTLQKLIRFCNPG